MGEFEYVIVEDIADVRVPFPPSFLPVLSPQALMEILAVKPHAFDEAVKGVAGIAHTASPFYLDAATVEELVGPAVEGTVNVMRSAKEFK